MQAKTFTYATFKARNACGRDSINLQCKTVREIIYFINAKSKKCIFVLVEVLPDSLSYLLFQEFRIIYIIMITITHRPTQMNVAGCTCSEFKHRTNRKWEF